MVAAALIGAGTAAAACLPHARKAHHAAGVLAQLAPGPRATISLYERTTSTRVLHQQGCHAARRGVNGIVILDFGQPAWSGRYGTNLFSGAFAGNRAITRAMLAYARGWAACGGRRHGHRIVLARGTSNYHIRVPSPYTAGKRWASETMRLSHALASAGLADRITAAAADDVEPAWDRTFRRTHAFYRGFHDARTGHLIYDFGSLDGGVGGIWSARQAFYVAGGMKNSRALPEIYNHAMAREWAHLAHVALHRYHRPLRFAGLVTQHANSLGWGFKPRQAHRTLVRALARHVGRRAPWVPPNLTDIRSAA